ncbi:protein FAR1-RELATED SEQUENCE 5-like [Impatiens glandulifera]|uniref:protein FAR1-RELATED SEQUENCE 5-like n=1 Tax=Impatiens glandulifera TaxID=253017 RepID=UPI001FB0AE7A|nr:protein FAR1-RELATED SEQUENCE 5-like [Impatiens glandulifera]
MIEQTFSATKHAKHLAEVMKDMKEKFKISPNCTTDFEPTEKVIHSPIKVRARWRPPTKRKQTAIEKAMKKPGPRNKKRIVESSIGIGFVDNEYFCSHLLGLCHKSTSNLPCMSPCAAYRILHNPYCSMRLASPMDEPSSPCTEDKILNVGMSFISENNLPTIGDINSPMDEPSSQCTEDKIPKFGMSFVSENNLREFYRLYAQSMGFGVRKLGTRNGPYGKQKFFSIGCAKSGSFTPRGKNIFQLRPSTKTDCKARINIVVRNDFDFQISSVILQHNHHLSPSNSRHIRSHKVLDPSAQRRLQLNDEAGITLAKSFQSIVVEARGYDNLKFDERTCRNFISEARRSRLGNGDAEVVSHYFSQMQNICLNFHYTFDLDEDSHIRNVFWADARCRASYDYFSDVMTFDTTYLTNRYDMSFAPFVGVNHHGQSILLGCSLLSSEDVASFTWLFKAWLTCMHGRAPKAIITDQCRSMSIAIKTVFPNTQHRYCLWHIMKKLPTKFSAHAEYKSIKKALNNIVYNSITIEECEENWKKMIHEFHLENNDWLNSLHIKRHKWIPVYVRCHFWTGMSTSQRSESINSFFDDYVTSTTSLK